EIDADVGALSGGWKMRVAIAKILRGTFDVLLLDEPTNHLDIESIVWLERFLKSVPSTIFMTSHDRDFMNRIVTLIVEIDAGAMLEHVDKRFGSRVIYDDFNFHVRRRERWCVMGKNGAGKSTLLKMVVGALPPDGGTVRLGAALKLGYFSQQSLDLLDRDLTVWEQMQKDFPLESIGTSRTLLGVFQFSGADPETKLR